MQEIILKYTSYNVWANQLLCKELCALSKEELIQNVGGSFPTIKETAYHIWQAESLWLQRLEMREHAISPTLNFTGTFFEACEAWLICSKQLHEFATKIYDERGFLHEFHYRNIKDEPFKSSVWECLQHVCNHSTFHRGQLVSYLRQCGKTSLPSTDFITFCRLKK